MSRGPASSTKIAAGLRETLASHLQEVDKSTLSSVKRRALRAEIHDVMKDLGELLQELDPIRQPSSVFDPGNPKIVGRFIALALVAQERQSLSKIGSFYGSGVYALYYTGAFDDYQPISGTETPIYVGQAAPAMPNARTATQQGDRLCRRLRDHRKSIAAAGASLDIDEFEFRSLVIQSGWETAAEDYLIHLFRPIWNNEVKILFGLGKHGDSAETRGNKRSPWDTIHPGRAWAKPTAEDAKTADQIKQELTAHFAQYPSFKNMEDVLKSFVEELRQV